ncbi:YraN family protein [Sansalvadorimonas sp. 2012CJ34-2]|uniref:UPF0102 protein M3P05_03380 n=1 Tax=Parendozoicomonas callyspongiae TaxID=2942213 RepID=A0ABT0PC72_9GAMM|nr:YraN family protein [Sansalvadorimonas sp. 2012CJ34-2]MCL6268983.1 YraN family protein [Sansalvadorimonas sp. 2012CJ34-2]
MFWKTRVHNTAGKKAEDLALNYLRRKGMKLRERNYACRTGELDLIMQDRDTLVFVEVRFRSHRNFGAPEESVDYRKCQRLIRTAQHYMQTYNLTDQQPCRFDIIAIQPDAHHNDLYSVNWTRDAFRT